MKIITVPCHFDNFSYILICEETGEAAIVDPAEYYPVYLALEKQGCRLTSVFCTHHHADHIGGLEDFKAENPALQIYGHAGDSSRIPGMNRPLSDGDEVLVGASKGFVLHTPGHTSGSLCYYFENSLFTGDTVFGAGCGRLFEGSPEQMYSSLDKIVERVPETANIYFGHEYTIQNLKFALFIEPDNESVIKRLAWAENQRANNLHTTPSTLGEELLTNPFYRCAVASVKQSSKVVLIAEESKPQDVFAVLRKLKDSF